MMGHEINPMEGAKAAMTTTAMAMGTVTTTDWQEEVYAEREGAPKLSLDRISHTFDGDLVGRGRRGS